MSRTRRTRLLDLSPRNGILRLPPYHQLGLPRIRMRSIKRIWCKWTSHRIDLRDPVLMCRRCGERMVAALLTNVVLPGK